MIHRSFGENIYNYSDWWHSGRVDLLQGRFPTVDQQEPFMPDLGVHTASTKEAGFTKL
jgi:hypothetical protein